MLVSERRCNSIVKAAIDAASLARVAIPRSIAATAGWRTGRLGCDRRSWQSHELVFMDIGTLGAIPGERAGVWRIWVFRHMYQLLMRIRYFMLNRK